MSCLAGPERRSRPLAGKLRTVATRYPRSRHRLDDHSTDKFDAVLFRKDAAFDQALNRCNGSLTKSCPSAEAATSV
jgi:hypothetical protein